MNPKTEIVDPFDVAQTLYEKREQLIQNIDNYIALISDIEFQEIQGGYFYNCKDVEGFCEPDDESIIYVGANQFSSIRPQEYEQLIVSPVLRPLYALHDAMVKIDLNYPLLFNLGDTSKQLEDYKKFQSRIQSVKLYIQPQIDEGKPPHLNGINYAEGLKNVLNKNLRDVLETYHHHVETIRDLIK